MALRTHSFSCSDFLVWMMILILGLGVSSALAQGRLVTDTITSPSLEGNLLGDPATRNITIYLPPSYDTTDNHYPVVYLIHGSGGNERSWAYNEYPEFVRASLAPPTDFPEAGFVSLIDKLIAEGKIQEMILVMPDISNKYGGSYALNSVLNGNYEDYLVKDIVSYIDAHYRTIPSRESRGIEGISMGGYVAMYQGMVHPEIFGAVASHSGPLVLVEATKVMQPMVVAENPERFTGPDPSKPVTSFFYMATSAMTPNLENPPFYVDLPFDENMQIREDVLQRVAVYDPIQMIPTHLGALTSLQGIFIDVGDKDEIGLAPVVTAFSEALDAAGVPHQFEVFDGAHMDKLYTRMSMALAFLSNVLRGEALALPPMLEIPGYYIQEKVPSPSLATNQLGPADEQDVLVYLPPSYAESPTRHYPVIYLLHGFTGNHIYFTSAGGPNLFALAFLGKSLGLDVGTMEEALVASGEMNEAILVMPSALNAYGGSWYGNSPLIGDYPAFIAEDLVSYIDGKYRTIPDRSARGLAGHSMGGYGTLSIALRYPEVFGALASMGPGWPNDPDASPTLIDLFVLENPDTRGEPVVVQQPEDLWAVAERPYTNVLYAIAAAWTPNLKTPPYFVDPPVRYPDKSIVPEVWEVWKKHYLTYQIAERGRVLAGTPILVTQGVGEPVLLAELPHVLNVVEALRAQGLDVSYLETDGDHITALPAMTAASLKFLSTHLTAPIETDLEANKALARRAVEEIWNQGKLYVSDEIYAPNYVYHDPSGDYEGPEARKLFAALYISAFPDLQFSMDDFIAEGDLVAVRWSEEATFLGDLIGIPPTGVHGTNTGIDILRIAGSQIVEEWSSWDMLGMFEQIGLLPPSRENYTWGEPSPVTGDPGDPESNKAVVTRYIEEAWNRKNLDVLDEVLHPEVVNHEATTGHLLPPGIEGHRQGMTWYHTAFPDLDSTFDLIAEGDRVVEIWTATGTHQGELLGIPPTGKKVTWEGITIYRMVNGKIAEMWWAWDALGLLQQIGAIPSFEPEDFGQVFFMPLAQGLNMVSLPLKPLESHTARSFAEKIGATVVIRVDAAAQKFIGWTTDAPDDGFPIEGGQGYIVNVRQPGMVAFTGAAWTRPPLPAAPASEPADSAWAFVVNAELEQPSWSVRITNTSTGAQLPIQGTHERLSGVWADLNRNPVMHVGDTLEVVVSDASGVLGSLTYRITPEDIRRAFVTLPLNEQMLRPEASALLPNYPNPFNPETWIPFQLAESGEVRVRIYDAQGRLVRTLALGTRPAGYYLNRHRAAYWDGRNERGEQVASGVYLVSLEAGQFTATRRMLLVK